MLELDDNYFKEEERCGFKIPSMMKRVWAVEMDVLTHIDRICMEYGLTYYAAFGTMLGAYVVFPTLVETIVNVPINKRSATAQLIYLSHFGSNAKNDNFPFFFCSDMQIPPS